MNTQTGGLVTEFELKELSEELKEDYVEINPDFATKMQMASRKVSLHDHRSVLGKQLTQERKQRNLTYNRKTQQGRKR